MISDQDPAKVQYDIADHGPIIAQKACQKLFSAPAGIIRRQKEKYMTQYLKPEREELEYRKKLLGSSCSMSWNHGTISFPEEEWDHYLDQYVNSDGSSALGRFIYCDHCGYFTGICEYERISETRCRIRILIQKEERMEHYGTYALIHLAREAKEHGFETLEAAIGPDNAEGIAFLKKRGFCLDHKESGMEYWVLSAQEASSLPDPEKRKSRCRLGC
jgi:RimJ/RimL family protein N-acetyltransferase